MKMKQSIMSRNHTVVFFIQPCIIRRSEYTSVVEERLENGRKKQPALSQRGGFI